jgi:hypothetical protein
MGEFVKKWMAGIGAAAVVIIIAAIAIGRMDHKVAVNTVTTNAVNPSSVGTPQTAQPSAPTTSQAAPAVLPAASAPAANVQAAAPTSTSPTLTPSTSTPAPSTPPQVAQPAKPQHGNGTRTHSTQIKSSPTNNAGVPGSSQAAAGQSTTPTNSPAPVQTAQAQPPPVSPPDIATLPVEQLAGPDTAAQTMQIDLAHGMRTTGSVNVNGNFTKSSTLVHLDDRIVTPGQNGALVTDTGNVVSLGPDAQFTAQPNGFALDSGASNVNTSTGLSTKIKEYTVKPVDPNLDTHYEVNWESDGVYVYARTHDVEIIGPCDHHWTLEEGKAVRIPDPKRCGGLIWLTNTRTWPYKLVYGAAVGAATGVGVCLYLQNHSQSMSSSGPCN